MDADGDTIDREFDTFSRIDVDVEDILSGDIFEKAQERARAGVLQPREKSDFKLVFHIFGEMPHVQDYDVEVSSVLGYEGE
jgi:hypothetical protein